MKQTLYNRPEIAYSENDFDGKLRKCTNPNCSWEGTRREAIRGTRGDYRCPVCLGKIQNNKEAPSGKGKLFNGEDLETKIITILSREGGLNSREILFRINGNSSKNYCNLNDLHYKLSSMVDEGKIRLGHVQHIHGRGKPKFFLESGFVVENAVSKEVKG